MSTRLAFGVLGPVRIWTDEGELGVSAVKLRSLLALLVLRAGTAVPVDELYEVAWEGSPPGRARAALHTAMTRLRHSVGPHAARRLVSSHPGYLLEARAEETDCGRFLRECERGRLALRGGRPAEAAALLEQALGLWRGDFLTDVPGPYLHDHYGRHLGEARLQAVEWSGEAELALGRQERLLPTLRALAAAHPLRERFHGQLMLALYRSGLTAEALEAYRSCRTTVRAELGVEPSPQLRELHQRILHADPTLALTAAAGPTGHSRPRPFPTPAQLPYDLADFTGRSMDVARLHEALDPVAGAAVAVVSGPGGVGKTSLAVHVAHRARHAFPDGQLYLDLRGAGPEPLHPHAVAAQVIRSLGLAPALVPTDEAECYALYRSLLAQRRVLLVLDNARDTAQLRPLLPGGATSSVLVTSRDRLAGLPATERIQLAVLTEPGARELLDRILGPRRAAAEPAATTEVLRACAGLPLALRVAAARLTAHPDWTIATLADRIGGQLRRLDELAVDDLAVRASLGLGYAGLRGTHPEAARALRLLGLWQGADLPLPAAAALLGGPASTAQALLAALTDAHLLEESAPGRYRFHDLVRLYAAERAEAEEPAPSRAAAVQRLVSWYLHAGAAAVDALPPELQTPGDHCPAPHLPEPPPALPGQGAAPEFTGQDEALAWYDTERDNLLSAVQHAWDAGLHRLCWQLPVTLLAFDRLRRTWPQWLTGHELALAAAQALGDQAAESRVLGGLGLAHQVAQRHERAVPALERALLIRRESGDRPAEARALRALAASLRRLGRHEEAHEYSRCHLELVRELGSRAEETVGLTNLACLLQDLGRYEEAVAHLHQALALARASGHRHHEGVVLCRLGDVHNDMRQLVIAEGYLRPALAALRESGDRHTEALALGHLARSLTCSGRHEQAQALLHEALAILTELDAPEAAEIRARLGEHAPSAH
ncbi:regulatory protein AfsR [Kitasatospora sp. MMS16-BH015]|uniref:AfsR/SARP family transcriptional regulator n=1 Tax=Kitasatospora sp. MMS16-BH015 TaxID=2018025 RepID=UPI000CA103C4|nr:BTAD domain-containing putative transcriptional regulator [Kitasatospora sp. MMS16-BH015]AUG77423.1 regulatory protein AfsR [Kitasatospora sp. MMS16-BH015]